MDCLMKLVGGIAKLVLELSSSAPTQLAAPNNAARICRWPTERCNTGKEKSGAWCV